MLLFDTMKKINIEITCRNLCKIQDNTFIDSAFLDIDNHHAVTDWIKKIYSTPIYESGGVINISYNIQK
jgi:hypothetical protein